eukprot:4483444-Pyramimonas_sp.AAC.2
MVCALLLLSIGSACATPAPDIFKHSLPQDIINLVALSNTFPTHKLSDQTHGNSLIELGKSTINQYRNMWPSDMRTFHFCELFAGKCELSKA